jgi:hypothetical protein
VIRINLVVSGGPQSLSFSWQEDKKIKRREKKETRMSSVLKTVVVVVVKVAF